MADSRIKITRTDDPAKCVALKCDAPAYFIVKAPGCASCNGNKKGTITRLMCERHTRRFAYLNQYPFDERTE